MSKLSKVLKSTAFKKGLKMARKRLVPIIMNKIKKRKGKKTF